MRYHRVTPVEFISAWKPSILIPEGFSGIFLIIADFVEPAARAALGRKIKAAAKADQLHADWSAKHCGWVIQYEAGHPDLSKTAA